VTTGAPPTEMIEPFEWTDRKEIAPPHPTGEELSRLIRRGFGLSRYRPRPLPDAAMQMLRMTGQQHSDFRQIAHVVERDLGLTAEVLGVVNTPFYASGSPIEDIEQAVNRLGLDALREVALQAALFMAVPPREAYALAFDAAQNHAVATSHLARRVNELLGVENPNAFFGALFHDIGFSASLLMVCDVYGEQAPPVDSLWRELDRIHPQVGWRIAREWRLPDPLPELVKTHRDFGTERPQLSQTAATIVVADFLATSCGAPLDPAAAGDPGVIPLFDVPDSAQVEAAKQHLGLDEDTWGELLLGAPEIVDTFVGAAL
jgi:HD-like signal output (HDOD) protein